MIARRIRHFPVMGWHHPFVEMERMSRQMDLLTHALFGGTGLRLLPTGVFPAVNVSEDKDRYHVYAELPGIKADDLNVQANGRNLAISGERVIPTEGDNIRHHRREREAGKFSRVIMLPGDVDASSVDAKLTNGVLKISIAKSEASKPKQITVSSN